MASFGSSILNHYAKIGAKTYGEKPYNKPFRGVVTRTASSKTAMVEVPQKTYISKYSTFFKYKKKYMCHDEHELANVGDEVYVQKSRPHSKRKHWIIHSFVRREPGGAWLEIYPEYSITKSKLKVLRDERKISQKSVKQKKIVQNALSDEEMDILSRQK